ncbi:MAG: hypothetical protein ACOC7S_00645 [Planctomycetota bacterium]
MDGRTQHAPVKRRHVCSDCGRTFPEEKPLPPIENLWQRVEAGEVMPSGQCPECGALCHLSAVCEMEVYHRDEMPAPLKSPAGIASGWPTRYRLVARVETERLEEAYRKTNTVARAWWENEGVRPQTAPPVRSTSVGDVVVTGDGPWLCLPTGWEQVERLKQRSARMLDAAEDLLAAAEAALSWFRRARMGTLSQMEEAMETEAPVDELARAVRKAKGNHT